MEQLVARRAHNPKVARSSRVPATSKTVINFWLPFFCLETIYFMFVTYVLYSTHHDKIYIGYTSDLLDRYHSHNQLATKGYTVKFRPWQVIHVEFYDSKQEALKREKELKTSRGRAFIRTKIQNELVGLLSVG